MTTEIVSEGGRFSESHLNNCGRAKLAMNFLIYISHLELKELIVWCSIVRRVFLWKKFSVGGGQNLGSQISLEGMPSTPVKGLKMLPFISSIHLTLRKYPHLLSFQDNNCPIFS